MNNLTVEEIEDFANLDVLCFFVGILTVVQVIFVIFCINLFFYFENYIFIVFAIITVIAVVVQNKIDNKNKATIISKVENFLPSYESKYNNELLQAINDKRLSFIKEENEELKIEKIKEFFEENIKVYEEE